MSVNTIRNAKYMALETFRKNGQGVNTPIWLVSEGNKLYACTESTTWKVKRIRNNSRVRICQSDWRGTPLGEWIEAQARILDDPEVLKKVERLLAAKYRLTFWGFYWYAKLRRAKNVIIEISVPKA